MLYFFRHNALSPFSSVQFSSVAQSCPTLCDPMTCSMPGLPVRHQLPEFTQTHIIELVMPSSHLILRRPLFLLPSIFPSIKALSNESVLCLRWPKYWRFSISPSNEYSGNTAASGIFCDTAFLVSSFTMIKAYVISSLLLIYSR